MFQGLRSREVTCVFHLIAEAKISDVTGAHDGRDQVLHPYHWLQSVALPFYVARIRYSPPPVLLRIGELLQMRAVVTSVASKWVGPWSATDQQGNPLDGSRGRAFPHQLDVSATFSSVSPKFSNLTSLARTGGG
jgi:hypothetical protein